MIRLALLLSLLFAAPAVASPGLFPFPGKPGTYGSPPAGGSPNLEHVCTFTGSAAGANDLSYDAGGSVGGYTCADPATGELVVAMLLINDGDATNLTDLQDVTAANNIGCEDNANAAAFTAFDTSDVAWVRGTEQIGHNSQYTMGATAATTFTCGWTNTEEYALVLLIYESGTEAGDGSATQASFGCPNPPSLNARANLGDATVITHGGLDNGASKTITAVPSGMTEIANLGLNASASLDQFSVAILEDDGTTTYDPAAYTCSSNDGVTAHTVEVYTP